MPRTASIWLEARSETSGDEDRDAARHGRLEAQRGTRVPRHPLQLRALVREQRLVRGHHGLAERQCLADHEARIIGAADDLDDDVDGGVRGEVLEPIGALDARRQDDATRASGIADADDGEFGWHQAPGGHGRSPLRVQQRCGDRLADRSQPDEGHAQGALLRCLAGLHLAADCTGPEPTHRCGPVAVGSRCRAEGPDPRPGPARHGRLGRP